MIIDIITNQDFHKNGTLAYIETFAVIDPKFHEMYFNTREDKNGRISIRIGLNAKFRDDGQIVWKIIYDKSGNIINERK